MTATVIGKTFQVEFNLLIVLKQFKEQSTGSTDMVWPQLFLIRWRFDISLRTRFGFVRIVSNIRQTNNKKKVIPLDI